MVSHPSSSVVVLPVMHRQGAVAVVAVAVVDGQLGHVRGGGAPEPMDVTDDEQRGLRTVT
jgi:hypothetical protein